MADLVGCDLVDGDARMDVRTSGLFHSDSREEGAAGPRVVPRAIGPGGGVDVVHAAEDLQLFAHFLQRLHGAGEFEVAPFTLGPPVGLDGAVREVNKSGSQRSTRGGCGQLGGGLGL